MANVFDTIPTGEGQGGNVFDTLPTKTAPKPKRRRKRTSTAHDFVGGLADTLTLGFADELGAGVRSLTGVNDRGSYKANLADLRDEAEQAGGGRLAGQLLGAFAPVGGGAAALKTGTSLAKAAAKSGGAFGAGYGAGSADGDLQDRATGAATGAALGAAGGFVGTKVLQNAPRAIKKAVSPTFRFVEKEKKNPLAAYRAEAAQDIKRLVDDATKEVGARSPKQLSANIAKRLNDLDDEYGAGMLEKLRALPMEEGRRIALRDAWLARHSISKDKLDALRGDVGGNAVADAILKARAARSLSEEAKDGGVKALARLAIDASGATAGAGAGGPLGGFGGLAAARIIGRKLVGGEANRTVSAVRTAKNAKKFQRVLDELGPTGAADSKAALDATVAGIRNQANAVRARRAAERLAREQARTTAAAENARLSAENAKIARANRRDNIAPSGGFYGLVYERTGLAPAQQDAAALKLLAQKVITPAQFDAFMKDPAKLMRGNGGNALIDRMARMADDGALPRDPKWLERQAAQSAPGAAPAAPEGKFIANPLAYNATARANQSRVSATLAQVQKAELDAPSKTGIATAVTAIGNTASKAEAKAIADELLDALTDDAARDYARQVLEPLLAQIKH